MSSKNELLLLTSRLVLRVEWTKLYQIRKIHRKDISLLISLFWISDKLLLWNDGYTKATGGVKNRGKIYDFFDPALLNLVKRW